MHSYSITLEYHGELISFECEAETEQDACDYALAVNGQDCEIMTVYSYPLKED